MGAWRWLVEDPDPRTRGAACGPWNMGVDEALLESARTAGQGTLRFYTWDGPWLSLGYGQPADSEREQACARAGVGVVRRSTGGRAVLHGRDLTYAVAAPTRALPAGLRATYERIGEALVAGLRELGVPVERETSGAPASDAGAFDCFAAPARDELVLGGAKLAGSAQRRTESAFLQHGSIRLAPDPPAAARASGMDGPGATSLAEHGHRIAAGELARALAAAFERVLGAELVRAPLSTRERALAEARGPDPRPGAPRAGSGPEGEPASGASRPRTAPECP
ncbi:MAG: lipoate--protein ligase family protein [Myxococcota bacterium]